MAEKRMFTNKIVSSDIFKEMPLSTQALYFHLGMNADDEGFLNNAKSVQRSILASDDDMKLLIAKNFIIPFESGVVVIKHWKMNNQIQQSRIKPTQYIEERSLLEVKENKAYTLAINNVSSLSADCQQAVSKCCPSVDKCSVDKISVEECSVVESEPTPSAPAHTPPSSISYESLVKQYGKAFVDERIERSKRYPKTNNLETVAKWCEEDFRNQRAKNSFNNFHQRTYDMDEVETKILKRQNNVSDDP